MTCPDPARLLNGQQSPAFGPYNCNAVLTYTCNSGYTLQGNNRITCGTSGQWSSPIPTCSAACEYPCCQSELNLLTAKEEFCSTDLWNFTGVCVSRHKISFQSNHYSSRSISMSISIQFYFNFVRFSFHWYLLLIFTMLC